MATAFRYVYRNICCTICCIVCRRRQSIPDPDGDPETGIGNRNPSGADGGPEVKAVTCWSHVRQGLTNTDDIRSVQVSDVLVVKTIVKCRGVELGFKKPRFLRF